jgi:hypothetical protein
MREENPKDSMQDFTHRMELIAWSSKVEKTITLNRVRSGDDEVTRHL